MGEQVYRKKSLEALSAPEQLNDYLRVTQPAVWLILIGVIVLVAGLFVWANFVSITSKASGTARVSSGVVTGTFDDQGFASKVETGMTMYIGDVETTVSSVGHDSEGNVIAGASADMPDGEYSCYVVYKITKVIEMLLNAN